VTAPAEPGSFKAQRQAEEEKARQAAAAEFPVAIRQPLNPTNNRRLVELAKVLNPAGDPDDFIETALAKIREHAKAKARIQTVTEADRDDYERTCEGHHVTGWAESVKLLQDGLQEWADASPPIESLCKEIASVLALLDTMAAYAEARNLSHILSRALPAAKKSAEAIAAIKDPQTIESENAYWASEVRRLESNDRILFPATPTVTPPAATAGKKPGINREKREVNGKTEPADAPSKLCQHCETPHSRTSVYCSDRCKVAACRERKAAGDTVTETPAGGGE
jgi:hypothetical protein